MTQRAGTLIVSGVFALMAGLGQGAAADIPAADGSATLIDIPGATYMMGDPDGDPNEAPREAVVAAFRIAPTEVTNGQFAAFVRATGYVTDPEKSAHGYVWTDRWRLKPGATWRHPHGPDSSIAGKADHPVVQVSWRDARAFCAWRGQRLPSEAEWEFAARGTDGRRFAWGAPPPVQHGPAAGRRANYGSDDCCAPDEGDGYRKTAPVGTYPAGRSPFGLSDMAGNVWEWTTTRFPGQPDWYVIKGGGWGNNPYCLRATYRHGNPEDIGLDMVGFRCAAGPSPA